MKHSRKTMLLLLFLLNLLMLAFPAHAKQRALKMELTEIKTNSEPYNPSLGVKLKMTGCISAAKVKKNDQFTVTFKVKNEEGKTVFKKNKSIAGKKIRQGGGTALCSVKWNGKTNEKKAKLVPDGTYTVTATLKCKRAKNAVKPKKSVQTATITIDNKAFDYDAVNGVIPIYTGTPEIDYLAELMVTEAGVKLDMPEDMRVRLIYNYMTVNFKHIVDISNVRPAYDLVQLAPQIEQYRKDIKKAVNAQQAKYSNKWSGELNHMVKRAGRCNNNSAAFAILLNHVGIKCKRIVGKVFSGKTQMNHFWNSAVVDGVTWYYDIDVEIHHYGGSGVSAFSQYRKTLEQSKKNHIYEAP